MIAAVPNQRLHWRVPSKGWVVVVAVVVSVVATMVDFVQPSPLAVALVRLVARLY